MDAGRAGRAEKKEDYRSYCLTWKERTLYVILYLCLDGMVSYLFYRSLIAFVIFTPGCVWFLRECKKGLGQRRRQRLEREFLEGMRAVSTALAAGYSPEHAFEEALRELEKMPKEHARMIEELRRIVNGLHMNQNLESLLLDLAHRSGLEDVQNFAQVFSAAKRSGGDLVALIRHTVQALHQRQEIRREIQVCLAGKRLEQNVMSLVPCLILFYVGFASPEFLEGLYHNGAGVIIMTACLAVYVAAWMLGRRIVRIEY